MISVIICTFNRADSLGWALESLRHMSIPAHLPWELIVVDNNSKDHTRQVLEYFTRDRSLPIRYLFEKRQGHSYARNTGVLAAHGEIIAFTDDDVRVHHDWLYQIKSTFDQFDCLGVGGRILPLWFRDKPPWLITHGPYSVIPHFDLGDQPCRLVTSPFGANMAFKKTVFEQYGLFRTDLGRAGRSLMSGEDTEFCRRLLKCRETLVYSPLAIIYHPVDKRILEKRYFQSWYFNYGRSVVRVENIPEDIVCWLDVPRYLFLEMAEQCLKWFVDFSGQSRFYHKLDAYQTAGRIYESFRFSKRTKSSVPSRK